MLETTILVSFNGGEPDNSDYIIIAELDGELNTDSDGNNKTSFVPGDNPYIRIHASNNVRIDAVASTDGGVISRGNIVRSRQEEWLFASRDASELDVQRLPVVPLTIKNTYIGRAGAFSARALTGGMVEYTGDVTKAPFLLQNETTYAAKLYQLIPPNLVFDDEQGNYNIYVVFYVTILE